MIRRSRRVKIIATLGPASADSATVADLFRAGADVFRINMSHASHDDMRDRVAMIRRLEEEFDRPIGILVDLQGPKLRVGVFADGAEALRKGDTFRLDDDPTPGTASRVCLPHPEILESLAPGDWSRKFTNPEWGTLTVEDTLRAMAWHSRHHTAHITELRRRMGW